MTMRGEDAIRNIAHRKVGEAALRAAMPARELKLRLHIRHATVQLERAECVLVSSCKVKSLRSPGA